MTPMQRSLTLASRLAWTALTALLATIITVLTLVVILPFCC